MSCSGGKGGSGSHCKGALFAAFVHCAQEAPSHITSKYTPCRVYHQRLKAIGCFESVLKPKISLLNVAMTQGMSPAVASAAMHKPDVLLTFTAAAAALVLQTCLHISSQTCPLTEHIAKCLKVFYHRVIINTLSFIICALASIEA